MSKSNIFSLFFGILLFQSMVAQNAKDSLYLKVNIHFDTHSLELNKKYSSKKDTLQIGLFKFYLSGIVIEYNDRTSITTNSYYLIDIENPKSLTIPICKKNEKRISKIKFSVGVYSLASVSGANSGDLDLQNGMYWAWQSGYINIKIEGKSNSCKTRKNEFQFHIGGYQKPNYALRTIEFTNLKLQDPNQIDLMVDVAKLFNAIELEQTNSIMIPGKKAMKIADLFATLFSIQ